MQKDISMAICFRFWNKFTKQPIFNITTPYLPFLATQGHYSGLYKRMKKAAAQNCEARLIEGKKWREGKITNRTIIYLPKGICVDMPYDVSDKDIQIILSQLNVLKMSVE